MKSKNIINEFVMNPVRRLSTFIYNYFKLQNVNLKQYHILHNFYIFLIGIILLFNKNLFHLIILLIIISLDAFSIVVLHNCPLTILEQKYLKTSLFKQRNKLIKKIGIPYKCNHEYEQTLEGVINVWMLIASKCLLIIFFKMCKWSGVNQLH
jgi:hypothetical protein